MARARARQSPSEVAALRKAADAALGRPAYSVTHKKGGAGGGDLHDYASIGPYWWPSPGKRGGLPYVRRDGKVNPESRDDTFDKTRINDFSRDVSDLALAWHFTGDKRYAEKATVLLKAWFLDPATRMNPNMNFAQAVPGVTTGRAEGVIELRPLGSVVEAIGLLGPSGAIAPADQAGLEAWFGEMVKWLATSEIGRAERAKNNNHGFFYDATLMHFALFARLEPVAAHVAQAWPTRRLAVQLAADGSLPEEIARTRSLHYSYFALEAASLAATLAECSGIDLWRARTSDGRNMMAAFKFVAPYVADPRKWPHPEEALKTDDPREELGDQMARPLKLAAWGMGDAWLAELASTAVESKHDWWLPAPQPGKGS